MITFTANIRSASAATDDAITTSSVGIPVTLDLSADFDGLAKTLCFKTPSAAVDIALTGDATESAVPPDVLVRSGEWLNIGIYAADSNGDIVIPTVWANAGVIQLGTLPSGVDPSAPTPSWVAQVQQMAGDALNNSEQAIDTANEAKEAAITAQDSAQASASAAAQSATEAESAEMAAANSAGDAAASATTAAGSAQTATEKASEAAASAAAAGTASDTATGKAVEAAQSADSAAQSAETAQNGAQAAQSAQTAAAGSASTATTKASEAAQSASQAASSATTASTSSTAAQVAQTAAEAAQAAAETAQTAAEQAAQSISDAAAQIGANKSAIDELADNLVPDGYEVYDNLYLNATNGNVVSTTNNQLKILVFPVKPSTQYRIWKATSTIMRVSSSSAAVPVGGASANRIGAHATASAEAITGTTRPDDTYLYVQLYATSDPAALRTVEANVSSLVICKDMEAQLQREEQITAHTQETYMLSLPWVRGSYYNGSYVLNNNTVTRRCLIGPVEAKRGFTIHVDKGIRFWTGQYDPDTGVRSTLTDPGTTDVRIPKGTLYDISVGLVSETGYTDTPELINDILAGTHFIFDTEIPDYWIDALPDIEYRAIERGIAAPIGDSFFFVTDTHWTSNEKHSSKLIQRLSDDLRIRTVICGGDYVNSHRTIKRYAVEEIRDYFASFGDMDVFATLGNHDLNNNNNSEHPEAHIKRAEAYYLIQRQNEKIGKSDPVSGCSYYDNPSQKVRYIQFPYYGSYSQSYINTLLTKVSEWFNELSSDWTVVLISHTYWSGKDDEGDALIPSGSETIAAYFANMMSGENKPTLAMWLVGHCHRDLDTVYRDSTTGNNILIVSTMCDSYGQNINSYNLYDPEVGTITEQAFDIVRIDTASKSIHFTRVGAGYDRDFSYEYD